ncbi:MAG: hypothetical protein AAGB31_08160 [Bdellovibrio sp.]
MIIQTLISLFGALALGFIYSPQHAFSFLSGSLLILLSFFLMAMGFGWIFQKKLIALSIGIIVFKYAILGIIIFTLVKLAWFNPLWFALGVASFILSAGIYALKEGFREGKENVI